MSKSLIKLIDAALIPAAVMICGKVLGLWFANTVFSLDWTISTDANNFFSVKVEYATLAQQIVATSYSNLIMFIVVFIGFIIVLIRALFLHTSHISPKMLAKLATNNLLHLIGDSFEVYHRASVWLVIMWLAFLATIVNVIIGTAYTWVGLVTLMCTFISTIVLLRDVAKEIDIAKNNLPKVANQHLKT